MTDAGGLVDREHVFVDELPAGVTVRGIKRYPAAAIGKVYADLPGDGFGFIILPASSQVHLAFALGAPGFERFGFRPLIGWVAGVHLDDLGKVQPKVFDGSGPAALADEAVVLQVTTPPGKVPEIGIVNIFTEGDGEAITFPADGFSATEVEIDGQKRNLARFIAEKKLDTRLPLVADYCGAKINVSFQSVDPTTGETRFYAPVFTGVQYRHARPVPDYVSAFSSQLPRQLGGQVAFSCNCILNYLHSNLEGRKTGPMVGPVTFGEIAYQLLNQTLAYLSLDDASR
jgi:hypothetical protein